MTIDTFIFISSFLLTNNEVSTIMITIIIINTKKMPNIIQFYSIINNGKNHHHTKRNSMVNKLYNDLINSGFSNCAAHHEAMKLLLVSNPNLKLSDLSQLTFEIINPVFNNYYENGIDNHSQN